jgi:hypothetical protein
MEGNDCDKYMAGVDMANASDFTALVMRKYREDEN